VSDEQAMARALELARRGTGFVSPNPRVGCVILRDGVVIGEGWHHRFGDAHAEVDAVRNAGGDVQGATVVVNLEPCSHYGKTPPCASLLVEKKVARVVIGMVDPNPQVAGRGINRLREAGIDVTTGVLQDDCERLNRSFSTYITEGRPYVVLKAAQSLDGCIATRSGQSFWITGEASRRRVHVWRGELDAVLVGANTVRHDDPELTVRLAEGRHPARVVLDPLLRLPLDRKIFSTPLQARTIVVCAAQAQDSEAARELTDRGIEVLPVSSDETGALRPEDIVRILAPSGIASVLVEGGAAVHSSFLHSGIVDELRLFYAPFVMGNGLHTFGNFSTIALEHAQRFRVETVEQIGSDVLVSLVR
jgi:diaminohydroxyphosphoribosylaminopyrimidine deaminase/5-amino-6-(5-phosphoribosylamino)uracil reductase